MNATQLKTCREESPLDQGGIWPAIIITIALVAINGMLASAELALMGLNEIKLAQEAERGDKKARLLLYMKQNPSSFLSTVQIGITLAGLLSGAFAADTLAQPIVLWAAGRGAQGAVLSVVRGGATFLITLLMTYFMLVFGELVPKRVAMQRPEKTARSAVGPINLLSKATKPLVRLLSASTNGVLRLMGINPEQGELPVTEEDVLLMMRQGQRQGEIEESEIEFLSNLFEFTDLRVEDAMTHRMALKTLPADGTLEEVISLISQTGFNKFPVTDGHIDKIVGVLYSKDIMPLYDSRCRGEPLPAIRELMRRPYFVPERKSLVKLFSDMKQNGERLAVVVDDYGGTAGVVTLMDIIEEIIGDIELPEGGERQPDGSWLLNGVTDLEDAWALLELEPEAVAAEHDTLSGFLIGRLGYVPKAGEHPFVTAGDWRLTVGEVEGARILTVHAQKAGGDEAPS